MALEFGAVSELGKMSAGPLAGHVDDVSVVRSDGGEMRVYVRRGAHLSAFNVSSQPGREITCKPIWSGQIFDDARRASYPRRTYPWFVTDAMLDDGSDGIIVRNEAGLGFYRFDPRQPGDSLRELGRDASFRDLYRWNEAKLAVVLIGRFYPDARLLGVLSRKRTSHESAVEFHSVDREALARRGPYPLLPLRASRLDRDVVARMSQAVDLYVGDVRRGGRDHIVLRTRTHQLEMYKFGDDYALEAVAKLSLVDGLDGGAAERLFFADLTGHPLYRDVVHFNRRGLFVYRMGGNSTDYALVNYHAGFSESGGWIPEHGESIRLVDTNGDGRDDLVFSGPKGLTVLAFDPDAVRWRTLLDPSTQAVAGRRFATVVAAVPSGPESILLTVDDEAKLQMARLVAKKGPRQTFGGPAPPAAVQSAGGRLPSRRKSQTPSQARKRIAADSPVARWTEQWADPSAILRADLVDCVSGALDFSLPILEPALTDPAAGPISLSYSSRPFETSLSGIVGSGWALDLPDSHILVDYRDSVFLEDALFYLTLDRVSFRLEPFTAGRLQDGVRHFREPLRPEWTVEYRPEEQRWIVGTETDTHFFGAGGKTEAVRWNLNWPRWRGPGNDVESLKPVPVAWYRTESRAKASGRSVVYEYDVDSVDGNDPSAKWTAAVRLKRIRAEPSATITFDYADKEKEEYRPVEHPFDSSGGTLLFPVPLRESHYLTACSVATELYSQRLEFKYETDGGRRLLTAIEQPIAAVDDVREPVFTFAYDRSESKLSAIQFSRGLKVDFLYDTIPALDLPDPHAIVEHPVEEQPALGYGHDYAAMVFRQRQAPGQFLVKILGVESLETVAELSPVALVAAEAATTQPDGRVVSYGVRCHADFFWVWLETWDKRKKICLFHRSAEAGRAKWNRDPACHWLGGDAIIRSSEAGVAIANGSKTGVVQLFELSDDRSKWIEHPLTSGRPVLSLEMSGHLIVGYDDHRLFACHPGGAGGDKWRLRGLEALPGLFRDGAAVLAKFQKPPETEKELLDTLKRNLVQLWGNTVAVSSLHLNEGDHRLSLRIRLFLLSSDYSRSWRRREFTVAAENVLQLRQEWSDKSSRYRLGYGVSDDGSYRVELLHLSGKKVDEDLAEMKRRRLDALEEMKRNGEVDLRVRFQWLDDQVREDFERFQAQLSSPASAGDDRAEEPLPEAENQPCHDASHAPCNDQCRGLEESLMSGDVALVVQARKKLDQCRADDWKGKWEREKRTQLEGLKAEWDTEMSQLESEWAERGVDSGSGSNATRQYLLEAGKSFQGLFLLNRRAYQTQMLRDGLRAGEQTFIRMKGDDWEEETGRPESVEGDADATVALGESFVLLDESDANGSRLTNLTLYGQDPVKRKQAVGPPLRRLLGISPPGLIINRYPAYLAYGTGNDTTVILFDDGGKTLGKVLTLADEQLVGDGHERLTTLATSRAKEGENKKLVTRSLRSIHPAAAAKTRSAVHAVKTSDGDGDAVATRSTGYRWGPAGAGGNVTLTVIPGNDRKLAGWIKETWRPERISFPGAWVRAALEMFDSEGRSLGRGPAQEEPGPDPSTASESLLWDRHRRRIISDFSPHKTGDQGVSYYGFESYELNSARWRFVDSDVVDGGFALTGSNFLRLRTSPMEGTFTPADQRAAYVASCWIRPSGGSLESTKENDLEITPHLKAIVAVGGTEVVRLLGRIMRRAGDWFYLEVLVDLGVARHLFDSSRVGEDRRPQEPQLAITIKIQARGDIGADVDHVRFSPVSHDFKATVYDQRRAVSVIGSSGSVGRTVYYRGREMAVVTDAGGQLEQLTTSTVTGRLVPAPKGSSCVSDVPRPCRVAFHPLGGGLHEIFDAYSLRNRWSAPDASAWTTAPGRLVHDHPETHGLASVDPSALFGRGSSAAVRCYYSLVSAGASMTWKWKSGQVQLVRRATERSSALNLSLQDQSVESVSDLPESGELIFLTEGNRFFLWIDSVLLVDLVASVASAASAASWSSFSFEARGKAFVEDCVFLADPRTQVEYTDGWGQKTQTIQLESDESVLVSQILYDSLGRAAIATKQTRVTVDGRKPLLTYRSDFVGGPADPAHPLSVWRSHRLQGEVDRLNPLDGGVAYFRTEYEANPLNEKRATGQPGRDFAVDGPYALKIRSGLEKGELGVVRNDFPADRGFRHRVEERPNGSKRVAVLDGHGNRVALYVYSPGYDHLLSTYEYDSQNRLVKMLPPVYHKRVGTLGKTSRHGRNVTSPEEMNWQKRLGTFLSYDQDTGRLVRKATPDTGSTEYYYNGAGQLRLQVHSTSEESDEVDSVVYYEYDGRGAVSRTGFLQRMPMSREELRNALQGGTLSKAKDYQLIERTEAEERHCDPSLSGGGRNATFVTHNDDHVVVEDVRWDGQDRLSRSTRADWAEALVRKTYFPHGDRLRSIRYAGIQLEHRYNKVGQLIGLKLDGQPGDLVRFSYSGSGQLDGEHHLPGSRHGFSRTFHYNSPGYLERIADPFLSESVSYTDGGYGQGGSGDGIVMRTTFNATWPPNSDWRWFQVDGPSIPASGTCLEALRRNGYVTPTGRPIKDYPAAVDEKSTNWMPLACGGRTGQRLSRLLAQKRMPRIYGHRYAYGSRQELVKAKYFTEETEKWAVPLQPDTLAEQTAMTRQQSRDVWKQLVSAGFILPDAGKKGDWLGSVAGRGERPLVRRRELGALLRSASTARDDATLYQHLMEAMILNDVGHGRDKLPEPRQFLDVFLQWRGVGVGVGSGSGSGSGEPFSRTAEEIRKRLASGKVKGNAGWLDPRLLEIFRPHPKRLADFVRIVNRQLFTYGLGEHPFDVESFDMDANGNHRKFYVGFRRYELSYGRDKVNQIRSVRVEEPGKLDDESGGGEAMDHDSRGNVVKALHKGIERIEYNGASARTTAIHLADGRKVRFAYDAQGERILKRVLGADGQLAAETRYVRDEGGRVLSDRRVSYSPQLKGVPLAIVSTAYVYGPRGLLGFVRNGAFHSVWSDHSGSVRLVLKDGQVVAAYDYLPYGQLMRSYGSDPAGGIFYRYTGQEWDEETGLYNYHARLYDPDIGRFYQPDPREQYFSPYKYVGNSPVSLIDPDGEMGFVLVAAIVTSALGGAYLSAAAANQKWNPGRWDWASSKTWLSLAGGAMGGAFIPVFAPAAVAAVGIPAVVVVTAGTVYLSAASFNDNWDPSKWDWKNPGTYDALFQGAGTGVSILGGAGIVHQFANKLSAVGKSLALTGTYGVGLARAYAQGASANGGKWDPSKWDWTDPGTLYAMVEGLDTGLGLPTDVAQMGRGILKLAARSPKQLKTLLTALDNVRMKQFKPVLASIAKGPAGKAAAAALAAYVTTGMANEEFDPNRWDGSSVNTYEQFLNGLSLGLSARNMLKAPHRKTPPRRRGDPRPAEPDNAAEVYGATSGQSFAGAWKASFQSARTDGPNPNARSPQEAAVELTPLRGDDGAGGLQYSASNGNDPRQRVGHTKEERQLDGLATVENAVNRKRKRKNEIFTDDESTLLGCLPEKRRRKRAEPGRKRPATCRVARPDAEAQSQLKRDPVGAFKRAAISTKSIADWDDFKRLKIPLKSGMIAPFNLVADAAGSNYHLKVGLTSNDDAAVRGHWVNTNEEIEIDPLGETRFIFTSELQSCSIYVKYNYEAAGGRGKNGPTMSVYHHNRRFPEAIYWDGGRYVHDGKAIRELDGVTQLFDGQGNVLKPEMDAIVPVADVFYRKDGRSLPLAKVNGKPTGEMIKKNLEIQAKEGELAEKYDQVIRYEDYLGFPGNYNDKMAKLGLPVTFATSVLYRDTVDGHWYFLSQKISYTKGFLDKENFKSFSDLSNDLIQHPNQELSTPDMLYLLQMGPGRPSARKLDSDVLVQQLESIPRSRFQAVSLSKRKFENRQEYKDFMRSLKEAGSREPAPVKRSNEVDVRDLDLESPTKRGRLPRSALTPDSTGLPQLKLLSSGAVRCGSWIDLVAAGHRILKSILALHPVLELAKLSPLSPDDATEKRKSADLLTAKRGDYRDVSVGNCYSTSADAPVVCYGIHGKTTVLHHSPAGVDARVRQDTYSHCRPVEWHGQPSVTCRGEETSFVHTPYGRNAGMTRLFHAVDSWLLLGRAAPAMCRQVVKLAGHLKNVWTGSGHQSNLPISDEDKERWREQLGRLERLVAENQDADWAFPLMGELKQQIASLSGKTRTETMDDVRAVRTMSERLSALMEDVAEVAELAEVAEVFHDCLEEMAEPPPESTSAEWLSTRLHHLTKNFSIAI